MSGGQFDYAYLKVIIDLDQLAGRTLPEMLEWMKSSGVSPDAIKVIREFTSMAAGLADFGSKICDLLRVIEWQASGDGGDIDKEVAKLKADNDFSPRVWRHPQGLG